MKSQNTQLSPLGKITGDEKQVLRDISPNYMTMEYSYSPFPSITPETVYVDNNTGKTKHTNKAMSNSITSQRHGNSISP